MLKILLAIDAVDPDISAIDFACYIAKLTDSKLTGVFLENVLSRLPINTLQYPKNIANNKVEIENPAIEKKIYFEKNIQFFKDACEKRNALCNIHRDRGVPVKEMIQESRFADLIILNAETSFLAKYEGAPTRFVRDVLEQSECPVIIAPHDFDGVDEIIFTYDGSSSSVFAIKQFTALFPGFRNIKINLLEVNKPDDDTVKEKHLLNEWLKLHYDNIVINVQHGIVKYQLVDYLIKQQKAFIVMGAYGRGLISNALNQSNAELIIKTLNIPIFITHHK